MWQNKRIEKHAYIEILDDFTYSMIILKHQETLSQTRYQKMGEQKKKLSKYGTCLSTMPPRNKIINNINSR